jgi:hypothetical protein
MKITRCATAVVEANYDYTYVRIHADDGACGTGRSVAVVAAYLVRTEALSPEAALDEVAALRGGRSEVSRRLCSMVGLRP